MQPRPRMLGAPLAVTVVLMLGAAVPRAAAQVSRQEALELAYAKASFAAERVFLTPEQIKHASGRAGVPIDTALVARYIARRDGAVVGRAYVDTHTVRTKKESLLVSLNADGSVRRVDVVAFLEPPEYEAPPAFFSQFTGRTLEPDLQVQRAIRPVAGATLTTAAVTDAVRRVLAIDAVLSGGAAQR